MLAAMTNKPPRIGPVIQRERKAHKLTLERLAARSGVSKSMLSQIERGEANPSFAVLWSLTRALGIEFTDLIGGTATAAERDEIELVTAAQTPEIRSSDGACRLRILSAPRLAGQTEWYEVEIAAGGKLDSAPHARGAREHFTALTDGFEIRSGDSTVRLSAGETARYAADVPHAIANRGKAKARGFLMLLYR